MVRTKKMFGLSPQEKAIKPPAIYMVLNIVIKFSCMIVCLFNSLQLNNWLMKRVIRFIYNYKKPAKFKARFKNAN